MRVVGMISGTSMDGIDVAAADLTMDGGVVELRPLGAKSIAYEPALRAGLAAVLPPATTTAAEVCRLDTVVGVAFAEAADVGIAELAGGSADLVVSHGQTIFHWVDDEGRARGTLQIGQPAWIAESTGVPVVADLRARDVAAGGHGAPLAGLFDHLLLAGSAETTAALNLGGIANLTVVDPSAETLAFDTGPASALIDAAVGHVSGGAERFDRDGARARRGQIDRELLGRLLDEPFYRRPPPKSTGKELFHLPYLLARVGDRTIGDDDLVATVTSLTALTVADACRDHGVRRLVVSGGGAANPVLMELLAGELPGTTIATIDELGIPADAKEAYFFALLGFLTVQQLAGNLPSATGASRPVVLGCVLPGRSGFPRCEPAAAPPTRLVVVGDSAGR
jgi:anhydro-N-acetylmuramic acid kinase